MGPGYLRQSADGALYFKIYVISRENAHPFDAITSGMKATAGSIPSDGEFYELTAVTHDGTEWRAMKIWPAFNWDMRNQSVLATGRLQSIMAYLDRPQEQAYLRLHFFEEYEIPTHLMSEVEHRGSRYSVRDRAEFEASGSKFEVRKREGAGETLIEARSTAPFPPYFSLRIQEAFQYLTAKPAFWGARIETEGEKLAVELISARRKSVRTQLSPPLGRHSIEFFHHGWRLFSQYLTYVLEKTEGAHWNPVAYHLYNATESTANSVDAWAIGVSVAVEALTSLIQVPAEEASPDRPDSPNRLGEFQARLREYVTEQTEFADFQNRIHGLINSMSNRRPQDVLHALATTGHVDKRYIAAWSDLRNRHVHPKLSDLKKPDPIDYQNLLEKIHRAEVLMHQLTFQMIGYQGPFTDHGERDWPVRPYPLGQTPPA